MALLIIIINLIQRRLSAESQGQKLKILKMAAPACLFVCAIQFCIHSFCCRQAHLCSYLVRVRNASNFAWLDFQAQTLLVEIFFGVIYLAQTSAHY